MNTRRAIPPFAADEPVNDTTRTFPRTSHGVNGAFKDARYGQAVTHGDQLDAQDELGAEAVRLLTGWGSLAATALLCVAAFFYISGAI